MLRGQCIQNGIYLAIVNRTGKEENIDFYGKSAVYGPRGNIIAELDNQEKVLVTEIDVNKCNEWIDHQQFWRDI